MRNHSINQINNVGSSVWTDEDVVEYNVNGLSRCFSITKKYAKKLYEEGERINSYDYDIILKKMKSGKGLKEFKESKNEYTIEKISRLYKISQKYATKIFEEGEKIGSTDYEYIYTKMKFMKGMKTYINNLQKDLAMEKQAGGQK